MTVPARRAIRTTHLFNMYGLPIDAAEPRHLSRRTNLGLNQQRLILGVRGGGLLRRISRSRYCFNSKLEPFDDGFLPIRSHNSRWIGTAQRVCPVLAAFQCVRQRPGTDVVSVLHSPIAFGDWPPRRNPQRGQNPRQRGRQSSPSNASRLASLTTQRLFSLLITRPLLWRVPWFQLSPARQVVQAGTLALWAANDPAFGRFSFLFGSAPSCARPRALDPSFQ